MDFFIAVWHIVLAILISSVALVPLYVLCGTPFILWGISVRRKELAAMEHAEDTVPLEPAGFTLSGMAHAVRSTYTDPLAFAQNAPDERVRVILIAAHNKYTELANELQRSGKLNQKWEEHLLRTIRDYLKLKGLTSTPEGQKFLDLLHYDFGDRARRQYVTR